MNPTTLYADADGNMFDVPGSAAAGRSGNSIVSLERADWIAAPSGTDYFVLPHREFPAALKTGAEARDISPVASFLPPGYVRLYLPAVKPLVRPAKKLLPQYAYCAAGWHNNGFVVTAQKIDHDPFWDPARRDPNKIRAAVSKAQRGRSKNRLLAHLSRCSLTYNCYTAQNIFLRQGEGGIPVSPACNARCAGCISFQETRDCPSSHQRLAFTPSVEEIVELAVPHLREAKGAIISFGQGCEGEPTLQGATILAGIREIRKSTSRGTIHVNTNGSRTGTITALATAGLGSVRISMNSARKALYNAYYRPVGYRFEDVTRSLAAAKAAGLFVSINLLVFPGVSDREGEVNALLSLINKMKPDLIQLRNLNIDPDLYMKVAGGSHEKCIGLKNLIQKIKGTGTRVGYFNKPV